MKHQTYFQGREKIELTKLIAERTGYSFNSTGILSQAFRRRSYCAEMGGKSNEIFEFIGDKILSYYAVKIFSDRCICSNIESDHSFRICENGFTDFLKRFTSNEALAKIVDEWGIAEYLIVGRCDEKNLVDQQTKVKADLLESIIGAIAIDSNWNPGVLEKAVNHALKLEEQIDSFIRSSCDASFINLDNAVTVLKELAEKERCTKPKYDYFMKYDRDKRPLWSCYCEVLTEETAIMRQVYASSKSDAKKAASYLVLCEFYEIQNQYGKNAFWPIWHFENGKIMPYEDPRS